MEFLSANDVTIDMKSNLISLNNIFYMISEGGYKGLESTNHDLTESSRICVVTETPSKKGLILVEEYKLVNPEIGTINNQTHSVLINNLIPLSSPSYPVPLARKELMKKELNRLIDLGIIIPSRSNFISPAFPIF